MYAKISNKFIDCTQNFFQFNSGIVVDKYYSEIRKGGSAFMLIKDHEKFWSYTQNIFSIKPSVRFAIFTGQGLITPHTDGGNDSVALNFYLQTNSQDSTIFYEKKDESINPYPKTNSYNVNDLVEVSSFKAEKFDTYLVNVQKIHGIQKSNSEDRVMISFRWRSPYTFNQILNSLTYN